jgi:hypothetical protein
MSVCEWLVTAASSKKCLMMRYFIKPRHTLTSGDWLPRMLHSNRMLPHQTNACSPGKSHHSQFSAPFPHKISSYSHSRLVWCAATTANLQASKRLCYVFNCGVWKEDAPACLLWESTWAGYTETLVFAGTSSDVMAISDLQHFQFFPDIYTAWYWSCSFLINVHTLTENYAEQVQRISTPSSHKPQTTSCWTVAITTGDSRGLRLRDHRYQWKQTLKLEAT